MAMSRHLLVVAAVAAMELFRGSATASAQAPLRPRIVNGVMSQAYPSVGALLNVRSGGYSGSCTGTMIGCSTFLTAAHCVCEGLNASTCTGIDPSDYKVYLQNVGILDVADIDADPTYDFTQGGDIAVVTLANPVDAIAPSPIHTGASPTVGTSGIIAGFGITADGLDDFGILRDGRMETASCAGIAEPSTHLCWLFEEPFDSPGFDSNTCQGDSGGPMFADLGSGDVLIGVTSGGDVCTGGTSFDTDVSVHAPFIQSIAGADLLNTTCGGLGVVGEPGVTVTPISFQDPASNKAQRDCRKTIRKTVSTLVNAVIKAARKCNDAVNAGKQTGPCPDQDALEAVTKALSKVTAEKVGKKCGDEVLSRWVGQQLICDGVNDSSMLASCMVDAAESAVDQAIDLFYATNLSVEPFTDEAYMSCQAGIAKASANLLKTRLKVEASCAANLDAAKVSSCPDQKATAKLQKAEQKAADAIRGACNDSSIFVLASTNDFGTCTGVNTVEDLISCLIPEAAIVSANTLDLIGPGALTADSTFEVPAGTALLRVTLNGDETSPNDIDLYLRQGAPASPAAFDHSSTSTGVWEAIEVAAPTAGTWHLHIDSASGDPSTGYQATVTTFQP